MIQPEANDAFTVRSVFLIDDKRKIRAIIVFPAAYNSIRPYSRVIPPPALKLARYNSNAVSCRHGGR
jgi:alkyl hydroperoxide reductase subunit AhpC